MKTFPKQGGSILPMLLFLLLNAAGCFWFASQGVASGETRLPTKNNHARHTISRTEKPAMFWTSISIFATLGTGCTGVAAWLDHQPTDDQASRSRKS